MLYVRGRYTASRYDVVRSFGKCEALVGYLTIMVYEEHSKGCRERNARRTSRTCPGLMGAKSVVVIRTVALR